jgi:hypothetical protein
MIKSEENWFGQEQLKKFKFARVYVVHFIDKITGQEFYKSGVTGRHSYDALGRFQDEEYDRYNISVVASALGPTLEALKAENELQQMYPKGKLWINEKFKGVRETFPVPTMDQKKAIIKYIHKKRDEWYRLRHPVS